MSLKSHSRVASPSPLALKEHGSTESRVNSVVERWRLFSGPTPHGRRGIFVDDSRHNVALTIEVEQVHRRLRIAEEERI